MKIKPRLFPHPVLSPFSDDLVDSVFIFDLSIKAEHMKYVIYSKCETNNQDLNDLIRKKQAFFAVHVDCNSTRFRDLFISQSNEWTFEIPADKLDGIVEVYAFILASTDIDNYSNANFHSDYEGTSFYISKGDILAVSEQHRFEAEKEIDPLKRVRSIFSVVPNHAENASPMQIFYDNDRIIVQISGENFALYSYLKRYAFMHSTLASIIVIPALVYMLELIKNTENLDELETYRWFNSLRKRLEQLDMDIYSLDSSDTIEIAIKIIGDPLSDSFKKLNEKLTEAEEAED